MTDSTALSGGRAEGSASVSVHDTDEGRSALFDLAIAAQDFDWRVERIEANGEVATLELAGPGEHAQAVSELGRAVMERLAT